MDGSVERFERRRRALLQVGAQPKLVLLPPPEVVDSLQLTAADLAYLNAPRAAERFHTPHTGTDLDVHAKALLFDLHTAYHAKRFESMARDMRASALQSVAGAFGVGKLVSLMDRDGGNVDTVNNARNGIYASEKESANYEQRGAYDKGAVRGHSEYIKAGAEMKEQAKTGTLTDAYTGKPFTAADRHDDQLKPSQDHVIAGKNVHDDAGRVLAGLETGDLANIPENLAPTALSGNSAKKEHRAAQVAQRLVRQAPQRKARLAELEARKDEWTDKERKEYKKLKVQDAIDPKLLADKEKQAEAAITDKVNKTYYTSTKFAKAAAVSAAGEGAKMGLQQALGIALTEFLGALMDEVRDLYREGRQHESFAKEAGIRMQRIAKRVTGKWKHMLTGLRDGFLSGLLSSIVTTLINTLVTTGRRLVRIIREGIMSLLRAVRLLVSRPNGMTKRQALHEASKVLVGAVGVAAGIALEEVISKQLLAIGLPFVADAAGAAIAAVVTAVCTGFAVYVLDKADLFNADHLTREKAIGEELDRRLQASIRDLEGQAAFLSPEPVG
jgi:hypothetical protein